LLLSASKLFVVVTGSVVIVKVLSKLQKKKRIRALILLLILIIGGTVPVYKRISELNNLNPEIAFQEEYTYDTPFNGVTLRLFQWRMAFEILNDKDAWLQGTGIGSRQEILNSYYKKYNVYTGNPRLGDRGYLGYNFHNQFAETTVGTGIPGVIILLGILIYVFTSFRRQLFFPLFVYIITVLFFMTESVLERQAGIMMFCLIILTNRYGLNFYNYD
jgi:O-antigen ligase